MRKGGGKSKGSSFERKVCKDLSLWVSDGKAEDIFWRTAMSGGRSTVAHKKGVSVRQCGDVCAVRPEGFNFADQWFVECKHVRNLSLTTFFLADEGGLLNKFWVEATNQAFKFHRKPMLIAKENNQPTIVIVPVEGLRLVGLSPVLRMFKIPNCDVFLFRDVIKTRYR